MSGRAKGGAKAVGSLFQSGPGLARFCQFRGSLQKPFEVEGGSAAVEMNGATITMNTVIVGQVANPSMVAQAGWQPAPRSLLLNHRVKGRLVPLVGLDDLDGKLSTAANVAVGISLGRVLQDRQGSG